MICMSEGSTGLNARRSPYIAAEERAHVLTHGLGILLSIAGMILMLLFALNRGSAVHLVASTIYGTTLILLYTASTIYHAIRAGRVKQIFESIDHAAIYLLIAGTYTPFALITLHGHWGYTLLAIIWGLAAVGTCVVLINRGSVNWLQLVLYLAMGWTAIFVINPLIHSLQLGGLILIVAGGVAYTGGVVFYLWHRLRFHHAIWHLCVLGGSICHFFAVFFYVLP